MFGFMVEHRFRNVTPTTNYNLRQLRSGGEISSSSDVAVVGGGLSGAIAAVHLARKGLKVTVFDLHAQPRPEFRAEQLVGPQVGRLADLGLLERMTQNSHLCAVADNGRLGKFVDRTVVDQFGVPYQAMVEAVRASMPESVDLVIGRVASIENGPERQAVVLSNGDVHEARLVVLATGLSSALPKRLGIEQRVIDPCHTLAIGFDVSAERMERDGAATLVYYGENTRDRVDYLALFPMGDVVRANLFCYHEAQSDWVKGFCRDPVGGLRNVMPGLFKLTGNLAVTSPVQIRPNDLRVAQAPARDGIVLVGDAFQTPCPAAGTGIDRLLSDLDILCSTYVPAWWATPGMDAVKIADFYGDKTKQAFDAECLRIAHYRRAVSTRQSLWWTVHRKQVFFRRQIRGLLDRRRAAPRQAGHVMSSTG